MISELRTDLIADLQATEATILPSWLDKMTGDLPAIAVIPPSDGTYVEATDENFGKEYTVRFDLLLMVGAKDSETSLSDLEELVEKVLMLNSDWLAKPVVDFPQTVTVEGVTLLTTLIHLSHEGYL